MPVSTVSKILSGTVNNFSPETIDRVLTIAKENEVMPHSPLLFMNQNRFTISVILKNTTYMYAIFDGILEKAISLGYAINFIKLTEQLDEAAALSLPQVKSSSSILIEHNSETYIDYASMTETFTIPVFIFSPFSTSSLNVGIRHLSYRMTKILSTLGHKNIICMADQDTALGRAFFAGYSRYFYKNNIPFVSELHSDLDATLIQKLSTHSSTAIIFSDYSMALKVQSELKTLNFRIPKDLSMISLYDGNEKYYQNHTISTVSIPFKEFGECLCQSVIDRIDSSNDVYESSVFHQPDIQVNSQKTIDIPFNNLSKKILVIGSVYIDVYMKFDTLPNTKSSVTTENAMVFAGGKGTNMAVGAAKLGQNVELIGAIGYDSNSEIIFDELVKNNINHSNLVRYGDVQTGKAYIFVDPKGASIISILVGANNKLSARQIREAESSFKNTSFCLISTEIPYEAILESCKLAHKYGATTVLKPANSSELPSELLQEVDIIVPNKNELDLMYPNLASTDEKMMALIHAGVKMVILTLDADGCIYRTKEESKKYSSANFPSVDTTGGCDAFISSFASCLMKEYDMDTSLRAANYAAGYCISKEGVVSSLIDKEVLEHYIKSIQ